MLLIFLNRTLCTLCMFKNLMFGPKFLKIYYNMLLSHSSTDSLSLTQGDACYIIVWKFDKQNHKGKIAPDPRERVH